VPLDRRGQWYRYHRLFRDMLLAELERTEPGLMLVLRRRAAAWCRWEGLLEEALEYSIAAGDVDSAAELVERLWLPTLWQGRVTTLQRWFGWLDQRRGIQGHPMVAMAASVLSAATGRPAEAERWADLADRLLHEDACTPQDPATWAWGALLRAVLCRRGAVQMLADAGEAARRFAAHSMALPVIPLLQGLARVLSGDGGYRKLGASTRSQAVSQARELGLLDG
jgi:LuxR family transcriptional regulator, maltose regulon positive regulatory protein